MTSTVNPYARSIHAIHPDGTVIARYGRTGKLYAEKPDGTGKYLSVAQAVRYAIELERLPGGSVLLGRAGGQIFDAAFQAETQRD